MLADEHIISSQRLTFDRVGQCRARKAIHPVPHSDTFKSNMRLEAKCIDIAFNSPGIVGRAHDNVKRRSGALQDAQRPREDPLHDEAKDEQ